ncbi:response regulator [Legionella quateirensis]|uniref:histidine kinase n=1 Tax=Legionella quateirensis TaxID=45072 RepID=A0A378KRI1_9GAMM|nr:response regulator [Legionella quateirensis]KTD49814.1 sensory histidine-kinase / response regulator [Legionella quateirensis]STY17172.1 sensory histidine-kinase / response regulator [Legionella quateirensis]
MTKHKSSHPVTKKSDEHNKNKNEELDELIFKLKSMIDALPGDVYWKDIDGVWSGLNQHCAESLKRMGFISEANESYVVGKTDYDLFNKETADEYRKNDLEVMKHRIEITREEATQLPNGEIVTLLSKKRPFLDKNNNLIGIIGNSIDISDRKKMETELKVAMEKSEAASQAKTEFLENMRHDIRTPLTGIVGFADLLKMESDNPLIKEYSENLVASSHALLDLLDEVLEAIRVSSGEIPKLKKKFNLEHTLNHVIDLNRAKAAQKKLALSLKFDKHIPRYVIGDKVRLHRVALELVANALNFTDSGHVTFSAVLAKRHQRELVVKLIIEDSGIGIPKDKQQEIYVQFKRLTPSYKGIYKGAGLGLAVVKQFIDELSGEIYVESESRKGSRFTCVIPLQEPLLDDDLGINEELEELLDSPYEKTYAQEIKPVFQDKSGHLHHILVVEDNPIAQIVAKSILSKLKCSADIAESGKKALDAWKNHHYDLIFMDIGLPDMDGYEVTHLIRVHELTKKTHTPIIALTAHAGDENKKRCIDAGMNAVLAKPLTAVNCSDIIDAFIPGKSQESADKNALIKFSELPEQNEALFDLSPFPILSVEEGIKTSGNKTTLEQMLAFMVQDSLLNDMQLIKEAHANLDWDKTQQLAHKIKGGAIYVGTVQLKMSCQYLERYYKSGQRELLEPLYQQVLTVINQTIKEIVEYLKK